MHSGNRDERIRLCTYIVRDDTGLAPNPFWGWCTVAVCTPNHQGARLRPGDWLAGFLTRARGYRFLYAMEVAEILSLDQYYVDERFASKRPDLRGNWMQRCGDNFYSQGPDHQWIQHRNRFHLSQDLKIQDTRHAVVFAGQRFWYLGRSAVPPPARFSSLAGGRGIRVNHDPDVADGFRCWVKETFPEVVSDMPGDNPDLDEFPVT